MVIALLFRISSEKIPMWRGWNSLTVEDKLPVQNIGYMQVIPASPTQLNVVHLTMQQAELVRKECGERYMLTTYDLAVSKPALRIQETESPKLDKLFIETGPFHSEEAAWASVGYYITMSGLDELYVTAECLGPGSLPGFLEGRNYNRDVRVHPIGMAALKELHLREFLKLEYPEHNGQVPRNVKQSLLDIAEKHADDINVVNEALSDEKSPLMIHLNKYLAYCDDTRSGKHGLTPRYYWGYNDMVQNQLHSQRGLRTNDTNLFTYSFGKTIPLYWAANRSNYKRWAIKFWLQ